MLSQVWQLARFLELAHSRAAGRDLSPGPGFQPSLMDMWVLSQLAGCVDSVNRHLEARDLHLATRELRAFIYTDLCDTYVEYVKAVLREPDSPEFLASLLILHSCVLTSLKLLHPVMPFITEELFQRLPTLPKERRKESIMIEAFPQALEWNGFLNPDLGRSVDVALQLVTGVRHMKKTYDLGKGVTPRVLVSSTEEGLGPLAELVQRLAGCGDILFSEEKVDAASLPQGYISYSIEGLDCTLFMDVGPHIDYDKELAKIDEKLAKVERDRVKIRKSTKGKFQYRISPETAAARQAELDSVVTLLTGQADMIRRLKGRQDIGLESS